MTQGDNLSVHSGASPKANEEGIEQHYNKVEHSGKEATRLGRNSNNSNTDVVQEGQLGAWLQSSHPVKEEQEQADHRQSEPEGSLVAPVKEPSALDTGHKQ